MTSSHDARRRTGRGRGTPAHRDEAEAASLGDSSAISPLDGPGARIVLAAAVDAMAEHGYHGTSVRDIGERAGMSAAALYHHFPSKQTLLFTIMNRGIDELIRLSEEALAEAPDEPAEQLRVLVRVHVLRHIERQRESFLGNSELRSLDASSREVIVAKRDHHMRLFYDVVNEGVADGSFHTQFPVEAARSIVNMSTAVATWYRKTGPLSPEETARRYAELALAMVGFQPPLARRSAAQRGGAAHSDPTPRGEGER